MVVVHVCPLIVQVAFATSPPVIVLHYVAIVKSVLILSEDLYSESIVIYKATTTVVSV